MSSPSAEESLDAFVHVLREELTKGNQVEVPTLGTFSVEHHPSEVVQENGERSLIPPRDVVTFDPIQK